MDGLNGWKFCCADVGIIEQDMDKMLMYLKDSNKEKKLQSEAGGGYGWLKWLENLTCGCGDHRTRHGKDASASRRNKLQKLQLLSRENSQISVAMEEDLMVQVAKQAPTLILPHSLVPG